MARVLITGIEGRLAPAKAATTTTPARDARFYGKIHLVRGRLVAGDGKIGVEVSTIEVGDADVIRAISAQPIPGFFDLDSGVVTEFNEPREKVFGADYLGDERKYQLTDRGIVPREAVSSATLVNGAAARTATAAAR